MAKSKYPQALDTSVEIPVVRDNITEIGSDVINSLRSAIFKIESVLGINPQGATGNSVAERLAKSLDDNGNIKSEALNLANVLTGPIIDADVSTVASISESKLRLDYPTTLLQDEISILDNQIDRIIKSLDEVITSLSIHLNSNSLDQHSALSISVSESNIISSDLASLSLESDNLQDILEAIYNRHINYTGANISAANNSHLANQIYFDRDSVSDVIFSNDVQGAIEDLSNIESIGFRNALINITSNGRIRKGSVVDGFENNNLGSILIPLSAATYVQSNGNSTTTFSFVSPQTTLGSISNFDILTLSGAILDEDNVGYQIASFTANGSGQIQDITVYGGPKSISTSGLFITVSKNIYTNYNLGGFSTTVRPRSNKTNTPDVQFLNPDSAIIISKNIMPGKISSTSHTFNIEVDGKTAITIDTFVGTLTEQTLDSIVLKINDQAVDQHLNFTAFKIKTGNCYELAISHNLPNFSSDVTNRTLRISNASSENGTPELGFSDFLDIVYEGSSKNSLNLNGLILSDFGLIKNFTQDTIQLINGTKQLSIFSGVFSDFGIRIGDLVIITGSNDSVDDGTFRISNINTDTITLDLIGFIFSGELTENSQVSIVRATSNVGELTFEEIASADGTIIFDTFISEDKNLFHSKRLEIDGSLSSGTFTAVISDLSKNFIVKDQVATLDIDTSGFAILTDPNSETGVSVFVGVSGVYKIFGSDGLSFITLDVSATAPPVINQSITMYGFNEISTNNYHLCRGSFATSLGRILGTSSNPGIPSLIDKRKSGTADHTIIGESFIEKYIEGPRNELRASGIIKGFQIVNTSYTDTGTDIFQNFSVSAGVAIVNGIRKEFSGLEDIKIHTDQNYVIALDGNGCIISAILIDDPLNPGTEISPFFEIEVSYLAFVRNNGTNTFIDDCRLFIDHLDYKFLNQISVANDSRFGHFIDLEDAIMYSRRFKKMFPLMDSPSILIHNGFYEINSSIRIDFDLKISGSGPGTILTKKGNFSTGTALTGDLIDLSTALFFIGFDSNESASGDSIVYGVSLSNFTYQTADTITGVSCVIALAQPISKNSTVVSRRALYSFNNINFDGPASQDGVSADPNKIGEFVMFIGQQNPSTLAPVANLIMGNIIINNCKLNRMGVETGAIKMTESASSTLQDVSINNNIITRASPNLGSSASVVLEYPTTPTTENISENGNTFRTGN